MAQPYVGEIRMFAGNFPPMGWFFCDGQLLPISEYETLFMLIGTTYGGDGQSTFAVPDLRGRLPIHMDAAYPIGMAGGVEEVTVTVQQVPAHAHAMLGSTHAGTSADPAGHVWANSAAVPYSTDAVGSTMAPTALTATGGSQPHTNFQPYLCVNFIISWAGIFPSMT